MTTCKNCGCYIPTNFTECPACASRKDITAVMTSPAECHVVINYGDLFSHDKVYLHWGNLKSEMWKAKALFKWWIKEHYNSTDKFTSMRFKLDAPYAICGDLHTCDVEEILNELVHEKALCYTYNFGNDFYFIRPQTKKEFKHIAKEMKLNKNFVKRIIQTY